MHIQYSEEQRWLSHPVPRDGIVCTIYEDGKWVAAFSLPVAWQDMANDTIPLKYWTYARERAWATYARFKVRELAAQGAF